MDEIASVVTYHNEILIFTKYGKVFRREVNHDGTVYYKRLENVPEDVLRP